MCSISTQMELPEGEIYQRIGQNADGMPDDEPTITIFRGNAIATSPTIFYSRQIPEGGFVFRDITMMACRLRVRFTWVADQLDRPEFAGVAGPYVSELAILNNNNRVDVNAAANEIIVNNAFQGIYHDIDIIRPPAPFIQMIRMVAGDGEIYQRIGVNVDTGDDEPTITIFRGNVIATSPTIFYSRRIPEGGFFYIDIIRMSSCLSVSSSWLYDQLAVLNLEGGWVLRPLRALTLSVLAGVPDEEVCVICIKTKAESRNDEDDWATALGCESHSFHSACIQHWARTNRTCPTCRAPLS